MSHPRAWAAAAVLATAAILAASWTPSSSAQSTQPSIGLEMVFGVSALPTSITHAGDSRLFVTLKSGTIQVWDGSSLRPFLDITSLVSTGEEQGLLGLAFHPSYATNGFFYVNYTNTAGNSVIAR